MLARLIPSLPWALLLLPGSLGAQPAALHVAGIPIQARGALTYGTTWRAADRDPMLLGPGNAPAVGLPPVSQAGRNQDDGDLNFAKGDAVSSVLKGFLELRAATGAWAALVQAKAWYDFALMREGRPFGHIANGYVAGAPLRDTGYDARAAFRGLALQEAHLTWRGELRSRPLSLRAGDQVLPWGAEALSKGGLESLNPVDLPGLHRPGALPEEARRPIPALFLRAGLSASVEVEAFWQWAWRPIELDGSGTFFSQTDYAGAGGDKVFLGPGTDAQALAARSYLRRDPDSAPSGSQGGLGLFWRTEALGARYGLVAARVHSRFPIASGIKTLRPGPSPFLPGDPDGLNARYRLDYPEGDRIFALTASLRPGPFRVYGELSHQPDAPLQLCPLDLLNATASATAPTLLRADMDALPYGAVLRGYDRLSTSQVQLGLGREGSPGPRWTAFRLEGEVAYRRVHHLPDPARRRYGRSTAFPLPPDPAAEPDGFISASAWGYKVRARSGFHAAPGLDLLATFLWTHDVRGWASENLFIEGRRVAALSLKAIVRGHASLELAYQGIGGRGFNTARDRDTLTASLGWTL